MDFLPIQTHVKRGDEAKSEERTKTREKIYKFMEFHSLGVDHFYQNFQLISYVMNHIPFLGI